MTSPAPALVEKAASNNSVTRVMGLVLLALLPAVLAKTWQIGAGFAQQLLLAVVFALAFEALLLIWRRQPLRAFLGDLSAPVCAVLLALLLPPAIPWWLLGLAIFAALGLAKHWYGGLGDNLFNPAMVGYGLLLVVFPAYFANAGTGNSGTSAALASMGTMLALGGLLLIWKKIIPWYTPAAMLAGAIMAWPVADAIASPVRFDALFSGTLLLAAFFIVTDPVTGCLSPRGRFFFGLGAGLLTVLLTRLGGTPDGLPFAILLMNCAAPWLDQHTRPGRNKAGFVS